MYTARDSAPAIAKQVVRTGHRHCTDNVAGRQADLLYCVLLGRLGPHHVSFDENANKRANIDSLPGLAFALHGVSSCEVVA